MSEELKPCRWAALRALAEKACGTHKSSAAYGALLRAIDATEILDLTSIAAQPSDGALTNEGAEPVALMPVDRSYDVRAKMIIAFNERKKTGGDLDDCLEAAYKSALRFTPSPASTESRS